MSFDNTVDDSFRKVIKHTKKGDKLLITLEYDEKTNEVIQRETWTNLSGSTIAKLGFKQATGFKDGLGYTGAKIYAKKIGFKRAKAPDLESAESLRNFLESRATDEFSQGFASKTAMSGLQKKQILTAIPIIIGLVLGAILLFRGGF